MDVGEGLALLEGSRFLGVERMETQCAWLCAQVNAATCVEVRAEARHGARGGGGARAAGGGAELWERGGPSGGRSKAKQIDRPAPFKLQTGCHERLQLDENSRTEAAVPSLTGELH